jgi:hypothetical protein
MLDPNVKIEYQSTILDGGAKGPIFVISTPNEPALAPIQSHTASSAWSEVMRRINELKINKRARNSVSGPELYGLADSLVRSLLEELPGASLLSSYKPVGECTEYHNNTNNNTATNSNSNFNPAIITHTANVMTDDSGALPLPALPSDSGAATGTAVTAQMPYSD